MKVELLQDPVDRIGLSAVLVYAMEHVASSFYQQCLDFDSCAVMRYGGDARGYAKTKVVKSTTRPLQIEDGTVGEDVHLLRG